MFDAGFQIDSSLNWVFEEMVEGEVDVVVPLWNGDGHVVFAQPGLALWTGIADEGRIDTNLGVVYRTNLLNTLAGIDAITGVSVFYDNNFRRGHSRVSIGFDAQHKEFRGAFNYYQPLSEDKRGRTDYIENAIRGMDARLAFQRDIMRLSANLGYWRYEGNEAGKSEWELSYGLDASVQIVEGVFIEGGYEQHDEDASIGDRLNLGVAFRFSLPDFKGRSYADGSMSSDLYRIVEREKRILYEEREANTPVELRPVDENRERLTQPSTFEEGNTVTIAGDLEALPVAAMLELVIDDASSADLGTDFSYGHKVYVLDEATEQQSEPDTVTNCPEATCEMMIPAGVTMFDVEIEILDDSVAKEIPEEIVLRVNVPAEHQNALRSGETTVVIRAHGNEITFAAASATMLGENGGTAEVSVEVNLPSPTPITLNVSATDDSTATEGEDYRISTRSLVIPANATGASLMLTGLNDEDPEGDETIELMFSGNPEGWDFSPDPLHTVTIQDDDLSIFFTSATPGRVEEPASDQSVTVTVGITQAPTADIKVMVAAEGSGETATSGTGNDYTFTATELTFPANGTASQTATLMVLADATAEPDEFIVLTLADDSTNSRTNEGSGFSLGANHRITIPANDNTVGFASGTAATLGENGGTANVEVSINNAATEDITLSVSVDTTKSTATPGTDFTFSPSTLRIPAGQTTGTITLTGIDNTTGDGSKSIVLTLTGTLPAGWTLADAEHTVTLQDDDKSISFTSGTQLTVNEPASGAGDNSRTITVGITEAPSAEIKVKVMTGAVQTGQTAATSGADYNYPSPTLTFNTSNLTQTFDIAILGDSDAEGDEFIVLMLADDSSTQTVRQNDGFSLGGPLTIRIPANDNTVGFASDATATLDESGGTASVEVSTTNAASVPITLNVSATGDSTATEGTDYRNLPASVTISAGQTTGTITLTGIEDQVVEGDETIVLMLSARSVPTGWALGTAVMHTVTISDDPPPNISFSSGTTGDIDGGMAGTSTTSVNLIITPASTSDITIPLTFMGDHVPISDAITVSGGTATLTGKPSTNNVMINVPANLGTVTLAVVSGEDCDRDADDVSFSLGTLPAGYVPGSHSTWRFRIHDGGVANC